MRNLVKHKMLYLMIAAMGLLTSCYWVNEGELDVRTSWGKAGKDPETTVKGPGLHGSWVIGQSNNYFSTQMQKFTQKISSFTADGQESFIDLTVNYTMTSDKAEVLNTYKNIGYDYKSVIEKLLPQNIYQVTKDENAKWEAMKLISNRDKVTDNIEKSLKALFLENKYPVTINTVRIENIDFNPEFKKSIENKMVAYQKYLEEQNNTLRVSEQNKQTVSKAQAEAEAIKVMSDAADRNPKYIPLKTLEKWDGKLPLYMGGNSVAVPFAKDLGLQK